jgi:hypothetical protein
VLASFLIGIEVGIQKIGKEKDLEYDKHDEEFDQDNDP